MCVRAILLHVTAHVGPCLSCKLQCQQHPERRVRPKHRPWHVGQRVQLCEGGCDPLAVLALHKQAAAKVLSSKVLQWEQAGVLLT